MKRDQIGAYIAGLPIGENHLRFTAAGNEDSRVGRVDAQDLPDAVVTGGNLIEFDGEVDSVLRSSVALSLLAAQRVASHDSVVADPDQWINRHNTVLRNLNWLVEAGGTVEQEFDTVDVSVHKAIIPFLVAAFGGATGAASLILTALRELSKMNEDTPWIRLFERESRRFNISEYHFTRVATDAERIQLNMAAARFDASYGRTQVLFFKVTKQHTKFEMASSSLSAEPQLLRMTNDALKLKLATLTNEYICDLDIGPT